MCRKDDIMQNRFRSKVLWAAIVTQIITIMQLTGLWKELGVDAGQAGDVAAAILQLLVLFSILNNPTDSEKF